MGASSEGPLLPGKNVPSEFRKAEPGGDCAEYVQTGRVGWREVLRRRDEGKGRADWWQSSPLELQNFPAQTRTGLHLLKGEWG